MTPRKQRTARSVCGVTCALAIMAIAVPATAQNTRHNAAVAHAPTAAQPPPSQQSSSTWTMPSGQPHASLSAEHRAGAPAGWRYSPPPRYAPQQHAARQYAPRQHASPPDATVGSLPRADDDDASDATAPPNVDIALSTLVPISVGGQATLEIPGRILLQLDAGYMPQAYGSAINDMMQSFGVYDTSVAAIIDSALDGATVVRASLGWRPFESAGLELWGGYTSASLSGSVSPQDVGSVVGGQFASDVAAALIDGDITLSSQLHNIHAAIGWRWLLFDHLALRASVGYMQTLASSSSIEIPGQDSAAQLATPHLDEALGDVYANYVKLPTLGLSAGYRF